MCVNMKSVECNHLHTIRGGVIRTLTRSTLALRTLVVCADSTLR